MNQTVNNEPIKCDIDCLIFNPIDYHNSFDQFHYNSHHCFIDLFNSKSKNNHQGSEDQITFISKIFDESAIFELAQHNNQSDSLDNLEEYSFTKNESVEKSFPFEIDVSGIDESDEGE